MKKIIAVVLALSMAFAVCACGKTSSKEKASDALTLEEKGVLEVSRKADADTRQSAVDLLEGKNAETGGTRSDTPKDEISLVGTWVVDPEHDKCSLYFPTKSNNRGQSLGEVIKFYNDGTFCMTDVDGGYYRDGTYSIVHDGTAIEFYVKGEGVSYALMLRSDGKSFELKEPTIQDIRYDDGISTYILSASEPLSIPAEAWATEGKTEAPAAEAPVEETAETWP